MQKVQTNILIFSTDLYIAMEEYTNGVLWYIQLYIQGVQTNIQNATEQWEGTTKLIQC